ncbi:MAG TPA: GntR family transcriptional regulator [Burkholderiaceae bacterium]|nr:GntR family transcriptional regulator [Burkholderiaceae bacterium]
MKPIDSTPGSSPPRAARSATEETLSARVYERLRDEIISGALAPGHRLTLGVLKDRYGVGVTPLREAMLRLSASRLIVGEDRRGFRVAPATREHLADVLQTRQLVEALVLRSAFEAGSLEWEAHVLAAFHRLKGTAMYEPGASVIREEWELAHRDFHHAVLSPSPLQILLEFQAVLWDHAARYRNLVRPARLDAEVLLHEHEELMEAVLTKDVEMACMALRRHIRNAGNAVLAGMAAPDPGSRVESTTRRRDERKR